MTIKIEITGCNADDVRRQINSVAEAFTGAVAVAPPADPYQIPLSVLVEVAKLRCAEAGFQVQIETAGMPEEVLIDELAEQASKEARPAPADDAVAASSPEVEAAEVDAEPSKEELEALKDATIKTMQGMYFDKGGATIVNTLRRKYGKNFSSIEAERFVDIARELEELRNA